MTIKRLVCFAFVGGALFCGFSRFEVHAEPAHPILSITGSGSGASTILNTWTESQYTNDFIPRLAPRNDGYGFVPPVVSGDTGWSWSSSSPNQITSTPSGTVFPNPGYQIKTQAVQVLSGKTVLVPFYNRSGSTSAKSLVFNLIDYRKLGQLRSDFNKLAPAYINSGGSPATRNDAYARRIAVALLDWARWFPDYTMTAKNSASFIDAPQSYVLSSDLQRASDHNGLAHEWADDELLAFDAIYDSAALANLSNELGFDVRDYIRNNLFCNEGDFIVYHVPVNVAIQSNLSGPYTVLALVARVLNRPDYILWMDHYLDATVRQKIGWDGTLSEGMGYSIGYINENLSAAQNTRNYFLTRPAETPQLQAVSNRAGIYVGTLEYGQARWGTIALPNGQLPSFGDTPFNTYFSARNAGNSALLPAYGTVALGAGAGNQAVQVNQNFSGDNNHMRSDTTAYTLWAFNNELLGNIRYHNGTPGRQFTEQILAYNAVTIDRSDMASPDADTYGNGDITLYEPGTNGLAVTEIDGQRAYNNKASRYQRILLLNTADLNRPYLVDVFRVTGGTNHDYLFHGSIRFDSTWQCSYPLVTNPAPYPMLEGSESWAEPTSSGSSFPYYGFWRNVSSNEVPGDFQITYRDTSSAHRDVRLWMTDDGTDDVYIGNTPVPARDNSQPANYWVNNLWRPSAIIRKRVVSGPLQDLFVSVIEPLNQGAGTIQSVQRLPVANYPLEACALRISFTDGRTDTYLVNLKNSKIVGAGGGSTTVTTADGQYSLTGRIGLFSQSPQGSRVWAVNASHFQYPGGMFDPGNLHYSGEITGETARRDGAEVDAFITATPLPLGAVLRGKQLSLTFDALSGSGTTGISEMFEIDRVFFTNGLYYICLTADPELAITNNTTVELVAPLRTFTGPDTFEIALSSSQPASVPGVPGNLTAVPADTLVALNWSAAYGAANYNVKRAAASGGFYNTIVNVTGTSYTDSGLTNGVTYYYVVSAVNNLGEGDDSQEASATPTANAPAGLVAHLTFDDGTARDSSGNGNNGTLVNGASVVNDPDRGMVLSLNGVNQYVDLGNNPSLDLSAASQATITAWVKVAVTHNHNSILTKGEWKDAYSLLIKGDTTPANLLWTGNDTSVFSGQPVLLNTWTHVAVTINGDLANFYINGQLSGSANQDRGNTIDNTGTDVCIGREQYAGSLPAGRWFFDGELDDVRLYKLALRQADIENVMNPPLVLSVSRQGGSLRLSWTGGIPPYQLETTTDLEVGVWQDINSLSPSNTLTISPGDSAQFFRVKGQ